MEVCECTGDAECVCGMCAGGRFTEYWYAYAALGYAAFILYSVFLFPAGTNLYEPLLLSRSKGCAEFVCVRQRPRGYADDDHRCR